MVTSTSTGSGHQVFLELIHKEPSQRSQLGWTAEQCIELARMCGEAFDNMTWLAEVHLPIAAAGFVCAILYGNEDCPDRVELFARNHYKCKPVVAEHDDRVNGLVVTQWGELPKKSGKWWSTKLTKG